MSLFGNLYIGNSGLQTSQNALNTVAHNLTNVDTVGYTRQQVAQSDRTYNTISVNASIVSNKQTGLGVYYSETRQVRDYFLDQTYREENGRLSFYNVTYTTFKEVENTLGELDGESFNDSLTNFWESIEELAKEPSSSVKQGLFIQRANQFLERAKAVYTDLSDLQDNLNEKVKTDIDRVNEISKRLFDLNNSILKIECAGVERANDLRDERNSLLDELGGLMNISYKEDVDGAVMVKAEGHALVTRGASYDIALYQDPNNGLYTPYWKMDARLDEAGIPDISNCKVYDLTLPISTARNTDVGSIKAELLARGDTRANYTYLDRPDYNQTTAQSVIMNVQAEFDSLIHSIVTKVNEVFASVADKDNGYMVDKDGNPLQIFQKIASDGYDATGNYIAEDPTEEKGTTLYTVANLTINEDLMKEATLIGLVKPDQSEDFELIKQLQDVFTAEEYVLNPNVVTKTNLIDFYSNLVSQIGSSGSVFKSVYTNQETTVNSTEFARQQVVGVSDDEELNNMIKFQNAYNANSRFINAINEMIEHIINTLGA
ncbi:MAG: flagellar hook-associated protein FlgK [Lachnospiraceae bacterium]|nr:flagellar hook-associated protein FlgK [Lachnospiraceae bacterium]MBQ1172457.1 flagellar hook-associated protein FlgK [Lachnospiraceae bacterium]